MESKVQGHETSMAKHAEEIEDDGKDNAEDLRTKKTGDKEQQEADRDDDRAHT